MPNAPFAIHPDYTAIAMAYGNKRYIADQVLPRTRVMKQEFKYLLHAKGEAYTVPDTKVGRKGRPNQVDFTASEVDASTKDYGLDDPVPQSDIDNAPENYDPLARATEGLAELIALDREQRVATKVFTAGNYPSGNKVTLSGGDQWSDYANSNPIDDIMTALDAMIMRANRMVIGRGAYTTLAQHPQIMKAVNATAGDTGVARRRQIAELFELEEVLVGESWVNTAAKGQAVSLSRLWGKHCALLHINEMADTQRGLTFGLTAQWGDRIAGVTSDPNIGLRGGQMVRVGESVAELITASDAGYLITDASA